MDRRIKWTKEEKEILIKNYPIMETKDLAKLLPNHTINAIMSYANLLGLHKNKDVIREQRRRTIKKSKAWIFNPKRWSKEEIEILKKNYLLPINELMKLLPNRSRQAIYHMLYKLNLCKPKQYIKNRLKENARKAHIGYMKAKGWSKEEIEILCRLYPDTTISKEEIMRKLPKRTWSAIMHKAHKLNLRRDHIEVIRNDIARGKYNPASWTHKKPTSIEQKLIDIINKYNLPFKYVGDGSVIIYGLNPDFIECNGRKKIIEVFGGAFHNPEKTFKKKLSWKQQEWGRKAIYSQLGYDCLILWDDEINKLSEIEIVNKIKKFLEEEGSEHD